MEHHQEKAPQGIDKTSVACETVVLATLVKVN